MIELDIVERLRGKVRVPVNDGAGLLDGKDFFERTFPMSKTAMEAADEIDRLRTENWQLRQACGYPIPVDKETPQNPFKCGICDARALASQERS